MRDLKYYAEKSINNKGQKALECNLDLDIGGEKFRAYEVSISNCDLLFFCDKGTVNYLIDVKKGLSGLDEILGIELFNVELDELKIVREVILK